MSERFDEMDDDDFFDVVLRDFLFFWVVRIVECCLKTVFDVVCIAGEAARVVPLLRWSCLLKHDLKPTHVERKKGQIPRFSVPNAHAHDSN